MSAIFITATGTDIGKTFVAAGLIRHLRGTGREVGALKPVVSGFDSIAAATSDPGMLLAALGRPANLREIERISPWRYAPPLSPNMAARREGRPIDFAALVAFCQTAVAAHRGTLLIEGVGGVMVPLDDRHTVTDWMSALAIPVMLVTGSYLGSLSHTLTALDVLHRRGLAIRVLVVNETPGASVGLNETLETLARFAAPIPIVALPHLSPASQTHPSFAAIAALL